MVTVDAYAVQRNFSMAAANAWRAFFGDDICITLAACAARQQTTRAAAASASVLAKTTMVAGPLPVSEMKRFDARDQIVVATAHGLRMVRVSRHAARRQAAASHFSTLMQRGSHCLRCALRHRR